MPLPASVRAVIAAARYVPEVIGAVVDVSKWITRLWQADRAERKAAEHGAGELGDRDKIIQLDAARRAGHEGNTSAGTGRGKQ